MKNNMLILALISTTVAHAMEIAPSKTKKEKPSKHEHQFSITSRGTTIDLIKPTLDSNIKKIDINVFGNNQEQRKKDRYDIIRPVGTVDSLKNETGQTLALLVEEPCLNIVDKKKKIFAYYVMKRTTLDKEEDSTEYFTADQAISKASHDLKLCYKNVFDKGLKELQNNETKSIAFKSPLSSTVGFPKEKAARIAAASVNKFTKKNPSEYNTITFFVDSDKEFENYKKRLSKLNTENK